VIDYEWVMGYEWGLGFRDLAVFSFYMSKELFLQH